MIETFESSLPAGQMQTALRALALGVHTPTFAGLSAGAAGRLSSACSGFAELIEAGEDTPDAGMHLRSRAFFLISALSVLRAADAASPLSELDESWMITEVESELDEAIALFQARTGARGLS